MSLILAKAQDDSRAVIRLSKSGYGVQAAALSRSLIEAAINADYIQLNPLTNGKAYIRSLAESNQRLAKRMRPRSEERRVGKECRSLCDWSSDVCSSDLSLRKPKMIREPSFD